MHWLFICIAALAIALGALSVWVKVLALAGLALFAAYSVWQFIFRRKA